MKVDTSSFSAFVDRLEAATSPADAGPVQSAILDASDAYQGSMRERFASAASGDGTWAPLAQSTVKDHGGRDTPLLHQTGELEQSLQRDSANHVLRVTENSVIEGTENHVARFQHGGTKTIPPRPILVAPDEQTLAAMKERIIAGVREAIATP